MSSNGEKTPILTPDEALSGIARLTAAIEQVAEVHRTNPEIGTIRTIPASPPPPPVEIIDEPATPAVKEPAARVHEPPPERLTTVAPAPPAKPVLTDEQIYNKVARFLDPMQPTPLYVSKPIRGRVYFGLFPNYAEMLRAQAFVEQVGSIGAGDVGSMIAAVGELTTVIKGWLPEYDPGVQVFRLQPDRKKWPVVNELDVLTSRDPHVQERMLALWVDYLAWKTEVTPTEDELEKYYARRG